MDSLRLKTWMLIPLVAFAFAGGFIVRGGDPTAGSDGHEIHAENSAPQRWTCSMHPQIILPSNDQMCPICNMELIPLVEDGGSGLGSNQLALSDAAAALADVGVSEVQRRFVARRVPLVGKITADETRLREITARFGGRLEHLFLAATGEHVTKGMKLAEIYSPEIYGAQAELQTAIKSLATAGDGPGAESARRLVNASRNKLRLLGLAPDQIDSIAQGGPLNENLIVRAPFNGVVTKRKATEGQYVKTGSVLYAIADLSSVWVTLRAYERDLVWLKQGQKVEFRTPSQAGLIFSGEILFMDSILDEKTRTVEVRVQVENPDGLLKPGMLVSAEVEAVLDATGQAVGPDQVAEAPLVIPVTAPLLTGRRAVVYVRLPWDDGYLYEGRVVVLGPRADEFYLVEKGLSEGEEVVTRGGFKIDSALQILAKDSMMMARVNDEDPIESKSDLSALEVPLEFKQSLLSLLESYLLLQEELAGDDEAGSAAATTQIIESLAFTHSHSEHLSVVAAMEWGRVHPLMDKALQTMVRAQDIASRREPFQPLSDNLWIVFQRFGSPENKVVRQFHCPMAFDNDGANWMQVGKITNNPYFGDMMLRCGSQTSIIGEDIAEAKDGQ